MSPLKVFRHIILILCLAGLQPVCAQFDIDSLFNEAIKHAGLKEYNRAIKEANQVLKLDSSRNDVRLFLANVHGWKQEFEEANNYINDVYENEPGNSQLYDSWLNILHWSGDYKTLLNTLQIAADNGYPNAYNMALKTALAHEALGQYGAGVRYLNQHPEFLDSSAVRNLYDMMRAKDRSKVLSVYYRQDLFEGNTPKPQHLAYIDYGFRQKRNNWIFRLNYSNRYDKEDLQPEVDLYHFFNNGHYLYANYGLGIRKTLFPNHRLGLEYFLPFGKGWEMSMGGRYLYFTHEDVIVLTASLSKYISNWWFNIQPYYAVKESGNSITTLFRSRLYGENPINFWGLEIAYGNTPDDRFSYSQGIETDWLNSYRIKVERNFALYPTTELRFGVGYAYEEIHRNYSRTRIMFELLLKQRF